MSEEYYLNFVINRQNCLRGLYIMLGYMNIKNLILFLSHKFLYLFHGKSEYTWLSNYQVLRHELLLFWWYIFKNSLLSLVSFLDCCRPLFISIKKIGISSCRADCSMLKWLSQIVTSIFSIKIWNYSFGYYQ